MKWITKHSRMSNVYYNLMFKKRGFIKKHFLFLPVEIDGEVRWFEWVKIKWRIRHDRTFFFDELYYEWYPYEFVDN